MRVLLVSHRFPPDGVAGVERVTQSLAEELARRGDTVGVVTRRPNGGSDGHGMVTERLVDGASVYRIVGDGAPPNRFLRHTDRLDELFNRTLLESAPDVVHVMHLLGLSPRFLDLARKSGAAVVLTLHDYYFACPVFLLRESSGTPCDGPEGGSRCARICFSGEGPDARLRWGLRTAYFRKLLAIPDRVICPSEYVASFFRRHGSDPERTHVVPNGVALPPRHAPPRSRSARRGRDDELSLAFMGSVVRHKGVHVILDALRRADIGRVELRILGHAPDSGYVQDLYEQAAEVPGLRFRLFGSYEPERLTCLLEGVDCLVVPSLWAETFSIVTREAYRRGIPVVASRIGALEEAVEDGVNGLTFEVGRADELAAILRRFARDDLLLPRLSEGALATRVLTPAEHAEATLAVYERAMRDRPDHRVSAAFRDELEFLHTALIGAGFGGPQ